MVLMIRGQQRDLHRILMMKLRQLPMTTRVLQLQWIKVWLIQPDHLPGVLVDLHLGPDHHYPGVQGVLVQDQGH